MKHGLMGKNRVPIIFLILCLPTIAFCAHQIRSVGSYQLAVWSPDREHLAYVFSDRSGKGFTEDHGLRVLNLEHGTVNVITVSERLTGVSGYLECAAWQTGRILWFKTLSSDKLYWADLSNFEAKYVASYRTESWYSCAFDPRLHSVLYYAAATRYTSEKSDLYTLDVNTLTVTQITDTPDIAETAPTWSQDGAFLIYGVSGGVNIQDREGNTRFVSGVNGDAFRYALSPDGKWFLSIGGYRDPGLFLISSEDGASKRISFEVYAYVSWGGDRVALITVGVPGRNELLIKTVEELGIPEHIKTLERSR